MNNHIIIILIIWLQHFFLPIPFSKSSLITFPVFHQTHGLFFHCLLYAYTYIYVYNINKYVCVHTYMFLNRAYSAYVMLFGCVFSELTTWHWSTCFQFWDRASHCNPRSDCHLTVLLPQTPRVELTAEWPHTWLYVLGYIQYYAPLNMSSPSNTLAWAASNVQWGRPGLRGSPVCHLPAWPLFWEGLYLWPPREEQSWDNHLQMLRCVGAPGSTCRWGLCPHLFLSRPSRVPAFIW